MDEAPKLDRYNMRGFLEAFPGQFEKGLEISRNVRVDGDFYGMLLCGVGGSALPGELLIDYLGAETQIKINRDYSLPGSIDSDTLVFVSSYSGNTEEALSAYEQARNRGLKVIGFCSGGKLEELCKAHGTPFVKYPKERHGFQPRFALGYAFASMCRVLYNCGLINDETERIMECAKSLRGLKPESGAMEIAKRMKGKIPLIYTSERFSSLGYIIKIKFNENSKIMAFCNRFPEMNHNEIIGHTNSGRQARFHTVMLKEAGDHQRTRERMEITGSLIKSCGGDVTNIELRGDDMLTKMFSALCLFDWVSYFLALEYSTDPTPVDMVEKLKKELKA